MAKIFLTHAKAFNMEIALLEINALVGTTGPTKKPIETVRGVIVTGIVTAAVMYLIAQAVLGAPVT